MPRVKTQRKKESLPTINPWREAPSLARQHEQEADRMSGRATNETNGAAVQESSEVGKSCEVWDRRLHPLTLLRAGEGMAPMLCGQVFTKVAKCVKYQAPV
jgi:hypothetical protein